MQYLQVIVTYDGPHAPGRPYVQPTKMFVIERVTATDRQKLRVVLNSDAFRGRFGVSGSSEGSQIVIYYSKIDVPFDDFFDQLFTAVADALAADEPARVP